MGWPEGDDVSISFVKTGGMVPTDFSPEPAPSGAESLFLAFLRCGGTFSLAEYRTLVQDGQGDAITAAAAKLEAERAYRIASAIRDVLGPAPEPVNIEAAMEAAGRAAIEGAP